ncbi:MULTISPECIES: 4'-phosphopantetheinyl transferase family protein [Streptomyces]|jgi:4'-phosphopantetheinyl transferase|uniref:4'-phosphopantetheinyl transferase domain-containing protein n=1 Tax=Streptomyces thermogriseus TaxID=75292 RepID=A0ABN1T518_9ACTN|nr:MULTISPECIES: 4'-phosphopantetheinyl transferase superfamily protein [Streptomyces]MDN5383426.1 4'-phosphopantetheinyl transferase superfamily protein [Streptomyces sp. LB8]
MTNRCRGRTLLRGPRLSLRDGEAHLWALRLPADGAEPRAVDELDAEERRRAAAFLNPSDRLGYLHAHIALRRLLSAYTGIAPGLLPLRRAPCPRCGGPHGRPVLAGRPGAPHFSLSHSHGLVLYGVAGTAVGVDVQRVPAARTVELCLPRLHPEERQEVLRAPKAQRPRMFSALWTRKEAYLKGLGTGLSHGVGTDYLGVHARAGGHRAPDGWMVADLHGCPGHTAAVALAATTAQRVTLRELPADVPHLTPQEAADLIGTTEPDLCMVLPVPAR